MIRTVATEKDETNRQSQWTAIHEYYHKQAVMLPLWGKRIPTLINKRLGGYVPGAQQVRAVTVVLQLSLDCITSISISHFGSVRLPSAYVERSRRQYYRHHCIRGPNRSLFECRSHGTPQVPPQ